VSAPARRRLVLVLAVVAVALAGCAGGSDGQAVAASDPPTRTATAPTSASRTSTAPSPSTAAPAAPDVETPSLAPDDPSAIVGRWSSIGQGRAQSVVEFRPDGSFSTVIVNRQFLAGGTTLLTLRAEGTYSTSGGSVALSPTSATRTFENPSDPAQDYVDQPYVLAPWSAQWSVDGSGQLLLTDVGGELRTYVPCR
jgi:hypothetical protein